MTTFIRRFVFALFISWTLAQWLYAQSPAFELVLSLNDGTGEALHPGWAVVVRANALLLEDGGTDVALDPTTAELSVKSAQGAAIDLPWRKVGGENTGFVLDESNDSAHLTWVLRAAEATALSVGDYTVMVEWSGQSSRPLHFTVAPEPSSLAPGDLERQCILESDAALLLGDMDAALAALTPAEEQLPDSLGVLEQKARVLVARGEFFPARLTTQRALQIFKQQYPDSPEPPVGILFIQRDADAGWLQSQVTANAPGQPSPAPAVPAAPVADPRLESSSPAPTVIPGTIPGVIAPASQETEDMILGDAAGQWAVSARAGSEYGPVQNSAARATGAPDVPGSDDHPNAWCPAVRDSGSDWLELTFEKAAPATGVRVRQNYGPGAIVKVEAIEPGGQAHTWWEGVDPYGQDGFADDAVWFSVRVPPTGYAVQKIRLTLDLGAHGRWKQIDAVQLIGEPVH